MNRAAHEHSPFKFKRTFVAQPRHAARHSTLFQAKAYRSINVSELTRTVAFRK